MILPEHIVIEPSRAESYRRQILSDLDALLELLRLQIFAQQLIIGSFRYGIGRKNEQSVGHRRYCIRNHSLNFRPYVTVQTDILPQKDGKQLYTVCQIHHIGTILIAFQLHFQKIVSCDDTGIDSCKNLTVERIQSLKSFFKSAARGI